MSSSIVIVSFFCMLLPLAAYTSSIRGPRRVGMPAQSSQTTRDTPRMACLSIHCWLVISSRRLVGHEHQGAGGGEAAAGAVHHAGAGLGLLAGQAVDPVLRRARKLAVGLDQH